MFCLVYPWTTMTIPMTNIATTSSFIIEVRYCSDIKIIYRRLLYEVLGRISCNDEIIVDSHVNFDHHLHCG